MKALVIVITLALSSFAADKVVMGGACTANGAVDEVKISGRTYVYKCEHLKWRLLYILEAGDVSKPKT